MQDNIVKSHITINRHRTVLLSSQNSATYWTEMCFTFVVYWLTSHHCSSFHTLTRFLMNSAGFMLIRVWIRSVSSPFDTPVMNNISKELIVDVQRVILMRKTNILKPKLRLRLHDNTFFCFVFFFFFFFYPCSIYYYSCEVLRLNLSHLAEHESFFFLLFLAGVRI